MILLTGTTDQLLVATAVGGADIEIHCSYVDNDAGALTPGRTNLASVTTATSVEAAGAPGASKQRAIGFLSIRNNHASSPEIVLVYHSDGTNVYAMYQVLLFAGELATLNEFGRWCHYDSNGALYNAMGEYASQTVMEAGTSTTQPFPVARQHLHPGHAKAWAKYGITGNVLASYNITSVSDTGTGRATVNIANDFSSADWGCQVSVERAATALAVANRRHANVENASQAAGSFISECYDGTAGTALAADPTAWHFLGMGDQ